MKTDGIDMGFCILLVMFLAYYIFVDAINSFTDTVQFLITFILLLFLLRGIFKDD